MGLIITGSSTNKDRESNRHRGITGSNRDGLQDRDFTWSSGRFLGEPSSPGSGPGRGG